MRLRPNEEAALAEAVPVWREIFREYGKKYQMTAKRIRRPGGKQRFQGETPDQILARHGIVHRRSFTGDYHRYGIVETELRRRATEEA